MIITGENDVAYDFKDLYIISSFLNDLELRLCLRWGSKRAITIVEACILSAVTVALGLLLLLIVNGWTHNSLLTATRETQGNIEVVRSLVVIESMSFDEDGDISLVLRNVSDEEITVVISRVELRSLETFKVFYTKYFSSDEEYVLKRGESIVIKNLPTCEGLDRPELREECRSSGRIAYRAYYIPLSIYERGLRLSTTEIPTGDSVITNPSIKLECPLPENGWTLMDLVDPVTVVSSGCLSSLYSIVWIEAPLASGVDVITVNVAVRKIGGTASASGSASINVPRESQQYSISLSGSISQICVPFKVTLSSPNMRMIPGEWIFGGQPNVAHISGLILSWRTDDKLVDAVLAELGFGQSGTYRISITIKDCNGKVIATGSISMNINLDSSSSAKATAFITLSNPVRLDQIYYVESEVTKIG